MPSANPTNVTMKEIVISHAVSGQNMRPELDRFAEVIGLSAAAPSRYSVLLTLELYGSTNSGRMNPAKVVHEISALEGLRPSSQMKPPTEFRGPLLRGLWHKHYLQDGVPSMAQNLRRGLQRNGLPLFEQRVREAEEAGEERFMTEADVAAIANDAVHGNWLRLAVAGELTGEWIIYAQHMGANYYLCIGGHDSGDEVIRESIESICCHEFPFLTDLLTPR